MEERIRHNRFIEQLNNLRGYATPNFIDYRRTQPFQIKSDTTEGHVQSLGTRLSRANNFFDGWPVELLNRVFEMLMSQWKDAVTLIQSKFRAMGTRKYIGMGLFKWNRGIHPRTQLVPPNTMVLQIPPAENERTPVALRLWLRFMNYYAERSAQRQHYKIHKDSNWVYTTRRVAKPIRDGLENYNTDTFLDMIQQYRPAGGTGFNPWAQRWQ